MNHIKKFIERVSHMESSGQLNLNMPAADARLLRDDLAKLLTDMVSRQNTTQESEVVLRGGRW